MGRAKRESRILAAAEKRMSGLKSIDKDLDFGGDVSVNGLKTFIESLSTELESYNILLSQVDEKLNKIEDLERKLRDLNERALAGVAVRFGKNSDEYEKAGGKKKSDRKRRTTKDNMVEVSTSMSPVL